MLPVSPLQDRRGIGALVRALGEGSAALVRGEIRLARLELAAAAVGLGTGVAFMAVAAVLALLGGVSAIAGVVLLIGDQWLPRDLYWVAALLVLVVCGAVAAIVARRGLGLVSPAQLAPQETMVTLKEDAEWMKQRLTSGATSS